VAVRVHTGGRFTGVHATVLWRLVDEYIEQNRKAAMQAKGKP
jgi:hypothetical protein